MNNPAKNELKILLYMPKRGEKLQIKTTYATASTRCEHFMGFPSGFSRFTQFMIKGVSFEASTNSTARIETMVRTALRLR